MADNPLWTPSVERVEGSRLRAFASSVGRGNDSYLALHAWSVADRDAFWSSIWSYCGVVGEPGPVALVDQGDIRRDGWFPDASLNVVETFLQWRGPAEALVWYDETGERGSMSRDSLRAEVYAVQGALRRAGVVQGDRVAAWIPNGPHAVVTMLAAASLGAVYSSTSPDFGTAGVLDRFGQIEPKVLVAAAGYRYGGKLFDCTERLFEIATGLPSLVQTVLVAATNDAGPVPVGPWTQWDAWLQPHRFSGPDSDVEVQCLPLPFDHPWYVLYSSGTTGKPKCIVHRAGGVLLKHLEEQQLQSDLREGDRVLYFTTTGWMMWNWSVSALASGATVVLYDGSPFHPSPNLLFDLAQREKVTLLGVSAKFLDACAKAGLKPMQTHDLSSVRTLCSTGSPLSPEGFRSVYESIKEDVHLASISGGTDLCGCFVGGDPTGPVYAGEIQRPMLGMQVEVWSEQGVPLTSHDGAGELVCTKSFPSMPLFFWGDPDGSRYTSAYFAKYPGVWAHGDFASWSDEGGMVVHGRSDTTLNPGGVRIGTAEIYRVVEQIPSVVESLVFGQNWDNDVRIVLLVRLAEGAVLDEELRAQIKHAVRTGCTPRHVPAVIAQVHDLPRTRSGKLVELAVGDVVHGRPIRNTEAIANPEALTEIAALPMLRA